MPDTDLEQMATAIGALESRIAFSHTLGMRLKPDAQAEFHGLVLEAKAMIDDALKPFNDFSNQLGMTIRKGPNGIGASVTDVLNTQKVLESAAKQIRRKRNQPQGPAGVIKHPYVSPARIGELETTPSANWDTTRLVRLLQELNTAHGHGLHMATAMLVRAIMDHVPPIFGHQKFIQLVSHFPQANSSGKNLKHLQDSMRNIADSHLHSVITKSEVLPYETQVDFRQDLDVLLQEVVRRLP